MFRLYDNWNINWFDCDYINKSPSEKSLYEKGLNLYPFRGFFSVYWQVNQHRRNKQNDTPNKQQNKNNLIYVHNLRI